MGEERQLTDADRVWLALIEDQKGPNQGLTVVQLLQHPDLADLTLGRVLRALRELLADDVGEVAGSAGVYRLGK